MGWSVGRVRVGSVRGRERARFLKFLRVRVGFKFFGCGAGADKKFQPAQDSITCIGVSRGHSSKFLVFLVILCFERRCRKQNTVALEVKRFARPKFVGWLRHEVCIETNIPKNQKGVYFITRALKMIRQCFSSMSQWEM